MEPINNTYSFEQKLDFILDALRKEPSHTIWHTDSIGDINSEAREIHSLYPFEFDYLLAKLQDDGLIQINTTPKTPVVKLLYKGYFFEGYVNKQNALTQKEREIKATEAKAAAIQKLTLSVSLILAASAIIAAVYYTIEVLKYFHVYLFCP